METISGIKALYDEFITDAVKAKAGNRAAGARARKTSLKLSDVLKDFRKESLSWPVSPKDKFHHE